VSVVDAFLREVDTAWRQPGPKIPLRIIGSTALMLQTSYNRGTKDSDVLETDEVTDQIAARLMEIAGPDSAIHRRRGMYVDIVRRGIPFRRQRPVYVRLEQLNATCRNCQAFAQLAENGDSFGFLSPCFGCSSLLLGSGRRDLNPRRRAPKARALPDCATPRRVSRCLAWRRGGAEAGSSGRGNRTKRPARVLASISACLAHGGTDLGTSPMQNFAPGEWVPEYHLPLDMAPGSPRRYAGPWGGSHRPDPRLR
jgi:hypothetical protein